MHLLLYSQCHTYPNDPQLPKDKNIPKLFRIVFQSSPLTTHRLLLLFIPILDVADVSRHPVLLADNLLAWPLAMTSCLAATSIAYQIGHILGRDKVCIGNSTKVCKIKINCIGLDVVSGQKNYALNDRRRNLRIDLWGYNLSMMEGGDQLTNNAIPNRLTP